MFTIYSNGNRTSYGIKHYDLDVADDLELLKKRKDITPGSTAFIIENSKNYKLNSKKEWVEVFIGSSNSSGDSSYDGGSIDGSDPITGGSTDDSEGPNYDGGSIDGSDPIM